MNRWIVGARVRTLPAALVPVFVGTALVVGENEEIIWWRAVSALLVALALQVGGNYANDLSDGRRGTDGKNRVGPQRLVGAELALPDEVRSAAWIAFGFAGVIGLFLSIVVTPWLLIVGGLAIVAGWLYTGGRHPYGYFGLGEVSVFLFFGLVATLGTTYIQIERLTGLHVLAATAVGLLACALLAINNLRDIEGDRAFGKQTLAVRLGNRLARWLYIGFLDGGLILGSLCALERPWCLLVLLGGIPAGKAVRRVLSGAQGQELVAVLSLTSGVQVLSGFLLAVGLALGS